MKKYAMLIALAVGLAGLAARQFVPTVHAQTGYTVDALKGAYGFVEQGGTGPAAQVALGVLVADGMGGVTGSTTLPVLGLGTQTINFRGTYSVEPSGCGNMTITYDALPVSSDAADATAQTLTATY